jgi:hypothetical protein
MKIETKIKLMTKKQRLDLHERADLGEALLLWELAVVTGYTYLKVLEWNRDGLPLMDGKIPKRDAIAWRKKDLAKKKNEGVPESDVSHLVPAVLRSGGPSDVSHLVPESLRAQAPKKR